MNQLKSILALALLSTLTACGGSSGDTSNDTADNIPPLITLIGSSSVEIAQGAIYNDAGAAATDNFDGDISTEIVIAGDTVDTNTVGTYIVT